MFRNSSNYVHSLTRVECNDGPSTTVPDMSLSLRDLLNRHKAGGKVKVFEPVYTGENSMIPDDFERMDQMEKVELAKKVSDFVRTTRGRIISAREAAKRDSYERSVIDNYLSRKQRDVAESHGFAIPSGHDGEDLVK